MKMSLAKTWKECLRMWEWIIEQRKQRIGFSVCILKKQWLDNNGYGSDFIKNDCFFCECAMERNGYGDIETLKGDRKINCSKCPGRLVAKRFSCQNLAYDWYFEPEKFYQKLLRVNRQRKQKGGKQNARMV